MTKPGNQIISFLSVHGVLFEAKDSLLQNLGL